MTKLQVENRTLFTGDNLEVMRSLNSETVDLIYLDPPFNKKFVFPIGKGDSAEFGFKDIWGWHSAPDEGNPYLPYAELYAFDELVAAAADGNPLIDGATAKKIVRFLETMGEIAGHAEMAYLSFMAARLVEMRRLLKPTGSIYLHCDQTMSHSLKLLLDIVFGGGNFRNEVVWRYGKMSNTKRNFPRNNDSIFFYTKSESYVFTPVREEESEYKKRWSEFVVGNQITFGSVKHKQDKMLNLRINKIRNRLGRKLVDGDVLFDFDEEFKVMDNNWYIPIIKGNSAERTGYPTQKPITLLERVITASSNEGDFVLDPFCGCATTCIAAERLNRSWCGIDVASHAANLVRKRLADETQQGKLGDKVPKIHHRDFNKGDCPVRTDMGETKSKNIRKKLFGEQKGECNLCRRAFAFRDFHLDHITPTSKGGPDVDRNLQLLCGSCNSIKHAGTMERARKRLGELGYI